MVPSRTPPAWFARKLREINRNLMVYWHDSLHRWIIAEGVPTAVYVGMWEGIPLYDCKKRPERILIVEDLGSKILTWLRRVRIGRFHNREQMIRELDIDKTYYEHKLK